MIGLQTYNSITGSMDRLHFAKYRLGFHLYRLLSSVGWGSSFLLLSPPPNNCILYSIWNRKGLDNARIPEILTKDSLYRSTEIRQRGCFYWKLFSTTSGQGDSQWGREENLYSFMLLIIVSPCFLFTVISILVSLLIIEPRLDENPFSQKPFPLSAINPIKLYIFYK